MDESNQTQRGSENQEPQAAQESGALLAAPQETQKADDTQSYHTEQPFTGPRPSAGAVSYPAADYTKLFSILSYFSVLWLLGLLIDPDNPKVRFHVNQGILLSIFSGAYSLVMTVLNAMFTFLPFMYIFTALLSVLGGVAVFALMVWGVVNAAQDKEEPLPVFGTLYAFIK